MPSGIHLDAEIPQPRQDEADQLIQTLLDRQHAGACFLFDGIAGDATDKSHRYWIRMTFSQVVTIRLDLAGAAPGTPLLIGTFAYRAITLDYWTSRSDGRIDRHESASLDVASGEGPIGARTLLFARGMAGAEITATVPEPESWILLLAGHGLRGCAARRRTAPPCAG